MFSQLIVKAKHTKQSKPHFTDPLCREAAYMAASLHKGPVM